MSLSAVARFRAGFSASRLLSPAVLALASLVTMAPAALAAIENGEFGNGEFFLVVWDPLAEASYTFDLGYRMDSLLVDGQKDEGFQRFWIIDPDTDPRFKALLDAGSAVTSLRWGVYAVDTLSEAGITDFFFDPGDMRVFTTLEHTVPTGTVNPNYTTLSGWNNSKGAGFISAASSTQVGDLNNENGNPNNTHGSQGTAEWAFNGSSYHIKGQIQYFDNNNSFPTMSFPDGPPSTNAVGSSSWAYQVLTSSGEGADTVLFDEFDNLTNDGFWGFTEDPSNGTFALSYTIEGTGLTLAQSRFAQAIGRTEMNRGFAMQRLSGVASSPMEAGNGFSRRLLDLDDGAPVSVVPEPSSWLLMGLGLGVVGWLARRRG